MRVLRFLRPEKCCPRRGHISFALTEGYIIFLFATIFVTDIGNILTQTGWVARGVLLLLLLFSIISWAMILQKLGLFGRIRRESDQFLRLFRATRGVANLRPVARGIAEALVTTAAGLFAAIPAVIFYNHFLQKIRDLAQRLDTFALEVTAQVEKTFD